MTGRIIAFDEVRTVVVENLPVRRNVGDDQRTAAGHRFQHDVGTAFEPAQRYDDVRGRVQQCQVGSIDLFHHMDPPTGRAGRDCLQDGATGAANGHPNLNLEAGTVHLTCSTCC